MADIQLSLGEDPEVIIDGVDVTKHVSFVGVQCEPGTTLPVVTISMRGPIDANMTGASVDRIDKESRAEVIEDYLGRISPEKLADAALERDELLNLPGGVVRAALAVLRENAHDA